MSITHTKVNWRKVLNLAVLLLLLYVIVPQIGSLHKSLHVLRHINGAWIGVALMAAVGTSLMAAAIYLMLALRRLRYGPTLLVQVAGLCANRLLPAGAGAISVNYEYLRRTGHSQSSAGAIVTLNNLLGIVGHLILLSLALLMSGQQLSRSAVPHISGVVIAVVILVLGAAGLVLVLWQRARRRLFGLLTRIGRNILGYRTHPLKIINALGFSIGLTVCYVLCLYACAHAVGIHLGVGQAVVVLTLGVAGGTVTPTPGGLLGAEAGLLLGLVALGVAGAPALAAVLLYRLLTYWLALAVGSIALWRAERHGYL